MPIRFGRRNSSWFIRNWSITILLLIGSVDSAVYGGGYSDEDVSNRSTSLIVDNDYGLKSDDKDGAVESTTAAQKLEDQDSVNYGGCKSPTIANGSIDRDGLDTWALPSNALKYVCDDGFATIGNGIIQCNGVQWQPSPDSICLGRCRDLQGGAYRGAMESSIRLEAATGASGIYDSGGPYLATSRWRFHCASDLIQKYDSSQYALECGSDGRWKLVDNQFMPVAGVPVEDASDLCEALNEPCRRLQLKPGVAVRYKLMRMDASTLLTGDEAIVGCRQSNYVLQSSKRVPTIVYRCLSNGHWTDQDEIASLTCASNGCPRPVSDAQLKPVYEKQDTRSHRQVFADDSGTVVRQGVRIFYQCDDPDRYYLLGEAEYLCNTNGSWTPAFWPRCERKKKCSTVDFPVDGYYNTNPNSDGFEPGHTLTFGCVDGFKLEGRSDLKCLDDGDWNFRPPTCVKDEWSTKRFIAVTSVACLLGILLVVVLGFFLQRQLLLRKALGSARRHRLLDSGGTESRLRFASLNSMGSGGGRGHQHPQLLAAAARTGPAAFDSDPDRLALIAFADGVQVPLPTYEEAVSQAINERRCHPPPFDAISTLSGYCSRAVRRLPSLSSLRSSRDGSGAPGSPRVHATNNGNQRSRLRDQWSSTSGSNVSSHSHGQQSRHIGSNETMGVSDASTNITLETVSTSGQSQSASARAYAGSLSSVMSSNMGGGPSTSIPVVALSACSASSMASSIGGTSAGGISSGMGGSQSEGLPLLESQELDTNHEEYENDQQQQQQQTVDNSDEICSQKSLET